MTPAGAVAAPPGQFEPDRGAGGPGDISGEALNLKRLVRDEDLYSSDLCPENE